MPRGWIASLSGVTVVAPQDVASVLEALAARPGAQLLAGGTDFMVEVNFGHRRPAAVVSLHAVEELRGWSRAGDTLTIGAGVTYGELLAPPLSDLVPALAQAARTVGSPQIRNAGTLGGNIATASPAGDTLPVLAALDAVVVVAGPDGRRDVPLADVVVGPKQTSLGVDELIVAVRVPLLDGPQEFLKVGTRNAMVIAVASVALLVDRPGRSVRVALGSVGPVPLRARAAEAWVAGRLPWAPGRLLDPLVADEFGRRVAEVTRPIDDHRSTADYRRHAIRVCTGRALRRAFA